MTILIEELTDDSETLTALAETMQEMQTYYQVPCPPFDEILRGVKERPEGSHILVVKAGSLVFGFAAYSTIYPGPYLRPGLFLKELYVREQYRGKGAGRALFAKLAAIAKEQGLARIDWTADANDERLLQFYDRIGGQRKTEKTFYRLDGDALKRLVLET